MRCNLALKYLSQHLDGELSPRVREKIETHLAACADCTREYQRLQAIRALTRDLLAKDPGPHFYGCVSRRLSRSSSSPSIRRRRLIDLWSLAPVHAKALAAAGLAFLLFFALVYPRFTTPSLPIESFQQEYLRSRDVLAWGEQPSATMISFGSGRG